MKKQIKDEIENTKLTYFVIPTSRYFPFPNNTFTLNLANQGEYTKFFNELDPTKTNYLTLGPTKNPSKIAVDTVEDLEEVAVLCRILNFTKTATQIKVHLEGMNRFVVEEFHKETNSISGKFLISEDSEIINNDDDIIMKLKGNLIKYFNEDHFMIAKIKEKISLEDLIDLAAYNLDLEDESYKKLYLEKSLKERNELIFSLVSKAIQKKEYNKELDHISNTKLMNAQKTIIIKNKIRHLQDELSSLENLQESNSVGMPPALPNAKGSTTKKEDIETRIKKLKIAKNDIEKLLNENNKLKNMSPQSAEYNVIKSYLDTVLSVPWSKKSKDQICVKRSKEILDFDHYGMEKVKRRILQFLAVAQKKKGVKGSILCLAGPPGVGKTSLGKSIASALGRKYKRISLGGVGDESEMRGHRRTYVGAMPGKFIKAMQEVKVKNPVIVLDEIDKLTNDGRNDPSAALLEILDPEQNKAFMDHYLEIPYDLSDVFFIATANDLSTIPAPLRDRMEIIHVSSYTEEEKFHITKNHLIEKQMKENGLKSEEISFTDDAIKTLINGYTRESGVRTLQRQVGSVCRSVVEKIIIDDEKSVEVTKDNLKELIGNPTVRENTEKRNLNIGVATGLAWTQVGGSVLYVETILTEGSGQLKLTGKLGEVIRESAMIALTYLKANQKELGIDVSKTLKKNDVHIHFPEGAVPKDGPSAGITLASALYSLFSGKKIPSNVAFTGEINLSGNVTAVGGIKEKLLAARRFGIDEVIISSQNKIDTEDLSEETLSKLKVNTVDTVEEAIEILFKKNK